MTAPAWCAPFIGLPYQDKGRGPDGWDCWGLVRQALRQQYGRELPDYSDAYQDSRDPSVATAVAAGLADGWRQVETPRAGDIVIVKMAGRPFHCGLYVGGGWILHTLPGMDSATERVESRRLLNRIEGYYRHD